MKLFGSIKELVAAVFRKNSQEITLRPNQTTTYTAARDIQLPEADSAQVIVGRTSSDTGSSRLQNKDLSANNVKFVDSSDTTKTIKFDASAAIANADLTLTSIATVDRVITFPDATTTVLGTDVGQIVSNKTLDNTNTLTIKDVNLTVQDDSDTTKQAKFQASSITTGTTRTFTLPDANTTIVGTDVSQTLTGKTIDGDDNTVQDLAITSLKTVLGDANKVLRRDASGVPQSGNPIPNSSEIVTLDATQILSNKTISGTLLLQNTSGAQPELALSEDPDNGTNKITIKAPAALAADYTLTLPADDGATNQILSTDGSGVLSWINQPGSAGATSTDLSSTNTTVSSGTTLFHPNLTIDTGTVYTINGRLVSENVLTVDGTLTVNGTSRVL